MHVTIYSDGSSRGNPGPGGYGSVLHYTDPSGKLHVKELSQGFDCTTNNRMELLGVIAALEVLKRPCEIDVISDSNTWLTPSSSIGLKDGSSEVGKTQRRSP